jgi:hypothetical protein
MRLENPGFGHGQSANSERQERIPIVGRSTRLFYEIPSPPDQVV